MQIGFFCASLSTKFPFCVTSMASSQMQDFSNSMMAYRPIYTGEENFNDPNVKNIFCPPGYLNTSPTVFKEIHQPIEYNIPSTSDPALNLQRGHFVSQRRSAKRKVSVNPTKLTAMPLVSQSQGLPANEANQSLNHEVPLGPRGGRKGKKVHVCEYPNCEKVIQASSRLALLLLIDA